MIMNTSQRTCPVVLRMRSDSVCRDNAKIIPTSLQGHPEVFVLFRVGIDYVTVGENHFVVDDIVGRERVLGTKEAQPT